MNTENKLPGITAGPQGLDPRYCRPERLHDLFKARAAEAPAHVAARLDAESITYGELDSASDRVARYLRSRGIGRGDYVAILLERSLVVYTCLLGILKAGAAYVPLDHEYPAERIAGILADSGARALLTSRAIAERHATFAAETLILEDIAADVAAHLGTPMEPSDRDAQWRDPCVVIYTSGSTGQPKGVVLEHRGWCNYVRGAVEFYGITPADRVLQGASLAFDLAGEEIWTTLVGGATLMPVSTGAMRSGPALSETLRELEVTVLSSVPTLVSMMDSDIPSLRLLVVGGERCSADLVRKWWRPDRRVVNSYGPTEATVIATCGDCRPDEPITLGRPVPNCAVWVMDPDMRPLPAGEEGEICLSGPGLARGYMNRPDLTAAAFVPNPYASEEAFGTLYRTGDLGALTEDGRVRFIGRVDGQVKLRGFRIELDEIEAVMREVPGVAAAAAAVRERGSGIQTLAGYVALQPGADVDFAALRDHLARRLPHYMVPAVVVSVDSLPTMVSGKVDRKRLPEPFWGGADAPQEPMSPTEDTIARCWEQALECGRAALDADFFRDLGGHSLMAAVVASDLRRKPGMAEVSVADIYAAPTVRLLAQRIDKRRQRLPGVPADAARAALPDRTPVSAWRHALCGAAQAGLLLGLWTWLSAEVAAPIWLALRAFTHQGAARWDAVAGLAALFLLVFPANVALAVAAKWLVIGRYRAGDYPLWGGYYLRWWFVRRIQSLVPARYISGTPLMNLYLRALGTQVGPGASVGTAHVDAHDLVSIGARATVGFDAHLNPTFVERGMLRLRPIRVAEDANVGNSALLAPGSTVGRGAALLDKSMLPAGAAVPEGEEWQGSPAAPTGRRAPVEGPPAATLAARAGYTALFAALTIALPLLPLVASLPALGIALLAWSRFGPLAAMAAAPLCGLAFVASLCVVLAAARKLAVGTCRPGAYPVESGAYVRRWLLDRLMMLSLDLTNSLYGTLYVTRWLRMLGAKVGAHAEVATAAHVMPDLLTFGEGSFIADAASLGAPAVRGGRIHLAETVVGERSFIGNHALVPTGTVVPGNCLIGCLSVPPAPDAGFEPGTSWLGSPAIYLPRRQESQHFPDEVTFRPGRALIRKRGAFELLRAGGPATIAALFLTAMAWVVCALGPEPVPLHVAALIPAAYVGVSLALAAGIAALKWAVVGRYRPTQRPLWSWFVWRTELITALYESAYVPLLMAHLLGTPFAALAWRVLGARVGRRAYIDTSYATEFDLVQVGDEAELGHGCSLQTHLFEDRVMKMDRLVVGRHCTVGEVGIVLYGAVLGEDSALGPLSLAMKGEALPPATRWEGCPARAASWTVEPPVRVARVRRFPRIAIRREAVRREPICPEPVRRQADGREEGGRQEGGSLPGAVPGRAVPGRAVPGRAVVFRLRLPRRRVRLPGADPAAEVRSQAD